MKNHQCPVIRGKGFGGTSLINGLLYSRGNRYEYDEWGQESNGWSYKDVLPFFKKVERALFPGAEAEYHGFNGRLIVEYTNYTMPHLDAFLDGSKELGLKILDYNGANQLGASKSQVNTYKGERITSARAFLQETRKLHLSPYSYVTKLLITEKKHVRGVYFMKNQTQYIAMARKEVILSAGAIGSPHILLLSGIGPTNHLRDKNISVVVDLPVGKNLVNQPAFVGLTILTNTSIELKSLREQLKEYLQGYGPLTVPNKNGGLSFHALNGTNQVPNVELIFSPPPRFGEHGDRTFLKDTSDALTKNVDSNKAFSIVNILMRPESIGSIELKSKSPFEYPLIDPKLFENDEDISLLYESIRLAQRYLETRPFQKMNASLHQIMLPACKQYEYDTKDYWYCMIRQLSFGAFHDIGTCRMGPNANNSVVNERLEVHGVKGLRIADASVLPFTLAGHMNSMAIMVGTRCADFLKQKENNIKNM